MSLSNKLEALLVSLVETNNRVLDLVMTEGSFDESTLLAEVELPPGYELAPHEVQMAFAEEEVFEPWCIHMYVQLALLSSSKRHEAELDTDVIEELADLWSAEPSPLTNPEKQVPLQIAICAAHTLQGYLLNGYILNKPLADYVVKGNDIPFAGIKLRRKSGKTYLHLRWDTIGKIHLDIKDKDTLMLYVAEREEACESGLLECFPAFVVDKRLKKGVMLDVSIFLE